MAERTNFGKLKEVLEVPDLIGIQIESYKNFLQIDVPPEDRKIQGLQEVFKEVFPIENFDKSIVLDFVKYELTPPKKTVVDCIKRGETYAALLTINFKLTSKNGTVEETVAMGEIPLMTDRGTFIISGAERVIISQLHRSPGICYEHTKHSTGRTLYSLRIIPDRGQWLDISFDINDKMYINLDKKSKRKKFLVSTFLRAIGYETDRDLVEAAYSIKKMTVARLKKAKDELSRYYTFEKIVNPATKATVVEPYLQINEAYVGDIEKAGISEVELAYIKDKDPYLLVPCIANDPAKNKESALEEIYKKMRPGDPMNIDNAKQYIKRLYFEKKQYDLGLVGRFKLNKRLKHNRPADMRVLEKEDLMEAVKGLMKLRSNTEGYTVDDIDHLGNRRVRTVGELLFGQCRVAMSRTDRLVRDKFTTITNNDSNEKQTMPSAIINPKVFAGIVRDFFVHSQLSQFMDQVNPLAELTGKRRLTALGPGGLTRERAGFEVRDVHSSHYGRICPIETPEGPNIGLITTLALYSRINDYGFIETPYRRVDHCHVTDEIDYLTADQEEEHVIAQANAPLDADNNFINPTVMCRFKGDAAEHLREEIDYIDVSPKQLISAAAGLIPFLEHDDANRALMGSNMQRQGVELMTTESPYIGTGLEKKVAFDSRAVLAAREDGTVVEVDGSHVVTTKDGKPLSATTDPNPQKYELIKFLRSNSGTCVNQRPIVQNGQKIKKGDAIADGPATDHGELALGKNLQVAFMPWCGYNFEDAIVLSERIVKEDVFTSIHIDVFEAICRDTKVGEEEITHDIPNCPAEMLANLEPNGVIRLGAEVKPGDILVGKLTPRAQTELSPEDRLLRSIFGEKAAEVKDSSLRVPPGKGGIVMDVQIEYIREEKRANATKSETRALIKKAKDDYKTENANIVEEIGEKLSEILLGKKLPYPIYDSLDSHKEDVKLVSANRKVTPSSIHKLAMHFKTWKMEDCEIKTQIQEKIDLFKDKFVKLQYLYDAAHSKTGIVELPGDPGKIRKVKVYLASKRKIQIGDKMAGRHGNKGIVSRIVPVEDMPFMKDGTPVDIVLNPLGVPSRMNIGQVLETHLGWAAKMLGFKIATPVFDGVQEQTIIDMMKKANEKVKAEKGEDFHWGFRQDENGKWVYDGKTELYDGRTGDKFDQRVMTGQIYMLKLDHLVANKVHARAVGPYSLVTQQPLGGKAQQGGQRFGEMEVWALEAYGAAYTLQEMLTVKSDDTIGRTGIYESIVKGKNILKTGCPESFNVLIKEIQSLGLELTMESGSDDSLAIDGTKE